MKSNLDFEKRNKKKQDVKELLTPVSGSFNTMNNGTSVMRFVNDVTCASALLLHHTLLINVMWGSLPISVKTEDGPFLTVKK